VRWYPVTYNDFVLIDPENDPAGVSNAYVLSDRGDMAGVQNRGELTIVVEGDKRLINQYGVMLVNPVKHSNVNKDLGQQFVDWLISAGGQSAIAGYKINGQQLFYPNADDPNA
jgi:tungstate transport system substrate-binding protein